jgi:hypothetical protein
MESRASERNGPFGEHRPARQSGIRSSNEKSLLLLGLFARELTRRICSLEQVGGAREVELAVRVLNQSLYVVHIGAFRGDPSYQKGAFRPSCRRTSHAALTSAPIMPPTAEELLAWKRSYSGKQRSSYCMTALSIAMGASAAG